MHFWNSKEFINVTNGGNLMSLSENRNGKNASTNFLTGGTTTVMSDNYRQMSATDIFCQDFASLPAVITGIDSSVHEDGAITGSGSGKNISGVVPPQTRDVSSKHQSNDPNILRGYVIVFLICVFIRTYHLYFKSYSSEFNYELKLKLNVRAT